MDIKNTEVFRTRYDLYISDELVTRGSTQKMQTKTPTFFRMYSIALKYAAQFLNYQMTSHFNMSLQVTSGRRITDLSCNHSVTDGVIFRKLDRSGAASHVVLSFLRGSKP